MQALLTAAKIKCLLVPLFVAHVRNHSVLSGFICQALGILFEAARLVSIQKLLHGMKMDPLVSLYYFAPVCATLNALLIPIYEGSAPFYLVWDRLGPLIMITNASCAFCLNIAVVFLIGCASSLVLTLSGVIKDILLVVGSVVLMGSTVTFLQVVGYGIALCKSGLNNLNAKLACTDSKVSATFFPNVKQWDLLPSRQSLKS